MIPRKSGIQLILLCISWHILAHYNKGCILHCSHKQQTTVTVCQWLLYCKEISESMNERKHDCMHDWFGVGLSLILPHYDIIGVNKSKQIVIGLCLQIYISHYVGLYNQNTKWYTSYCTVPRAISVFMALRWLILHEVNIEVP